MESESLKWSGRSLLIVFSLLVFTAMLVYGVFLQSVKVTRAASDQEGAERDLKGMELVSKAAFDLLSKVDGKIVEAAAGSDSDPQCPT